MSSGQQLWLGYAYDGRRAVLDLCGPGSIVLLLVSRTSDLAALVALSSKEAGVLPVILDLDGSVAHRLSGYFDTYDYRSFLFDAFRLAEPAAWHSQLAAAAYAVALDLSTEEEAIINSATQVVASDGSMLSPVSLRDVMGKVEGFRGFYVDKLNGRISSLRLLDAVEDEDFGRLSSGNLVIDFHGAPYPQAAELAAALFLAKELTLAHAEGLGNPSLLITGAHRLFKSHANPARSDRLLGHLLGWQPALFLSTENPHWLAPLLLRSCPVRVYSSDAWHSLPSQEHSVLQGVFVADDARSKLRQTFIPRRVPSKPGEYASPAIARNPSPELSRLILEEVERFPLCTPSSVVQYLSPEYLPADIRSALSSLERQGALILEPREADGGPRIFSYTISDRGRRLLGALRK